MMSRRVIKLLVVLLLLHCLVALGQEDRLVIDAEVNGKSVRLFFDTGAEIPCLFPDSAKRLGLKVTEAPADVTPGAGQVKVGKTEEFELTLGSNRFRMVFGVLDVPSGLHVKGDGVIGWWNLKDNIIMVEAKTKKFAVLERLPKSLAGWSTLNLQGGWRLLAVRVPGRDGGEGLVLIDTGDYFGVSLSQRRWERWLADNPGQPSTLEGFYTPAEGLVISEVYRAERLSFGELSICDVPVRRCSGGLERGIGNYEATLGLFALSRVDVVIDGKNERIYFRTVREPTAEYQYNRLGAVFMPEDMKHDELIAHVAEKGPAYEAGIRDGDVLLRIGELDVTKWREPRAWSFADFWDRRAGTEHKLHLRRGDKVFSLTVELKDILSAGGKAEE